MRFVRSVVLARIFVVASVAIGVPVGSAHAQGYNWNGFYGGLHWGVATTSGADFSDVGVPSGAGGTTSFTAAQVRALTIGAGRETEYLGGVQVGHNWQINQAFVVGVEADISGVTGSTNSLSNTSFDSGNGVFLTVNTTDKQSIDYLGTVRGRAGYLVSQPLLLYVTGGFAYAQTQANSSFAASYPGTVVIYDAGTFGDRSMRTGYTIGGGLEYAVASNATLKIEGLYYDLGTSTSSYTFQSFNTGNVFISTNTVTRRQDLDGVIGRLGINFKF